MKLRDVAIITASAAGFILAAFSSGRCSSITIDSPIFSIGISQTYRLGSPEETQAWLHDATGTLHNGFPAHAPCDEIEAYLKADPSAANHAPGDLTPLASAIGEDRECAITLLVDHGADVNKASDPSLRSSLTAELLSPLELALAEASTTSIRALLVAASRNGQQISDFDRIYDKHAETLSRVQKHLLDAYRAHDHASGPFEYKFEFERAAASP